MQVRSPISIQPSFAVVFVVDDDPSVRRALARLLRSAGYGVETFACAEDFLRQPAPNGPACLILDVGLPGMNGLELQAVLAERGSAMPVVFITAQGDPVLAARAKTAGAIDVLHKPFEDVHLLQVVSEALSRQPQSVPG